MPEAQDAKLEELLSDFLAGDLSKFEKLVTSSDEAWRRYSRQLPAGFYGSIRAKLVKSLMGVGGDASAGDPREPFRVRVVVDTSTIVLEAFRVGKGRPSSTPRLFESEFIELYAPVHIREESERIIREKLPKGADLEAALSHAARLINSIRILPNLTQEALNRARKILAPAAPEDIPFLAVALDTDSPFIVSTDRIAFDGLRAVERWYLKDYASTVVSLEAGGLSLVLLAEGTEAVLNAAEAVAIAVSRAIDETLGVLAAAATAVVEGSAEAIANAPDWAKALVLGVVVGAGLYVGIRAVLDEDFQHRVANGFSKLAAAVGEAFRAVIEWVKSVLETVWRILQWIWSIVKPLGRLSLLAIYVLASESKQFIETCERTMKES